MGSPKFNKWGVNTHSWRSSEQKILTSRHSRAPVLTLINTKCLQCTKIISWRLADCLLRGKPRVEILKKYEEILRNRFFDYLYWLHSDCRNGWWRWARNTGWSMWRCRVCHGLRGLRGRNVKWSGTSGACGGAGCATGCGACTAGMWSSYFT